MKNDIKLIIAGSRTIDKRICLAEFITHPLVGIGGEFSLGIYLNGLHISELVTGDCPTGADQVPFLLRSVGVESYGQTFEIKQFPAHWGSYGKAAGPIRNKAMAEYADALFLIWDSKSKGSLNMKKEMLSLGKQVIEVII